MEAINDCSKLVAQALENLKQHEECCMTEVSLVPETIKLLEQALDKLLTGK